MILEKIIINNFMPYKGKHQIPFNLSHNKNIVVIYGDNMRGKTSFLNCIRWAFYGNAFGRHRKLIKRVNIVNKDAANEGDWNTSVEIEFEFHEKKYNLQRTINKRKLISTPKYDDDFIEKIGIKINDQPLRSDKIEDEINIIMPEQISRFFLFDGELLEEYEMLMIEETDNGKKIKVSIEQVLGVPALIYGRDEIRTLLKDAQKKQAREASKDKTLKAQAEEQLGLQENQKILETDLKNLQEMEARLKDEINDLNDFLDNNKQTEELKLKMDSLDMRRKQLVKNEENKKNEKLDVLSDAWRDLIQPRIQKKIKELSSTINNYNSSIGEIAVYKDQINKLKKMMDSSICPTCKQDILIERKTAIDFEIKRLTDLLENAEVDSIKFSQLTNEMALLHDIKPSGKSGQIKELDEAIQNTYIELTSVESEIEKYKMEIEGRDTSDIKLKREKLNNKFKNLGIMQARINEVSEKLNENIKKQNRISILISESSKSKNNLSNNLVTAYSDLDRIFSKGIDELRENLKEKVTVRATETFKRLTTEKTYSALSINNNYGLSIIDEKGDIVRERSAGAEQIIALSLIDALSKSTGKSGPIVMDTTFGRLDPRHRHNVLSFLPDMARQVILLVHEGEIRKDDDLDVIHENIANVYNIERISSSQSAIIKE